MKMEFIIKNKSGKGMFHTIHESCIPIEKLDSMNKAGLSFWLDGKKVSSSYLKTTFGSCKQLDSYEYESGEIEPSDITVHMYGDKRKDRYPTCVISSVVHGCTDSSKNTDNSEEYVNLIDVEQEPTKEVAVEDFHLDLSSIEFTVTSRTIVCLNNGKVYRTQKEAGEDLGIDPVNISYSISTSKPYKGYTFRKALEIAR